MSTTPEDVFKLLGYVQDDLRGIQAKIVSVRAMLADLKLQPDSPRFTCPRTSCGIGFASTERLAEHLENVHGELADPSDYSTTSEQGATL